MGLSDLRAISRFLRSNVTYTASVVVSLGVGIGICAGLFNVINALRQRFEGVHAPEQVVRVRPLSSAGTASRAAVGSLAELDVFAAIAASRTLRMSIQHGDVVENVIGEVVTPDYFRTLGVRTGGPDFASRASSDIAVVSDRLWIARFGRRSDVIGSPILVDGHRYEVAGVAPPGFGGVETAGVLTPAVWIPIDSRAAAALSEPGMSALPMTIVARLRPDQSVETASQLVDERTAFLARSSRWAVEALDNAWFHPTVDVVAVPFALFLLIAGGLVALISCVNAAGLISARMFARGAEFAQRIALGATARDLRLLAIAEVGCLGLAAAAFATLVTMAVPHIFRLFGPTPYLGISFEVAGRLDPHVLAVIAAVSLCATAGIAMALSLRMRGISLSPMRESAGMAPVRRGRRLRLLLMGQVGAATFLLACGMLSLRSWNELAGTEFDARAASVTAIGLQTTASELRTAWRALADIAERARDLPGAASVGLIDSLPNGPWNAGLRPVSSDRFVKGRVCRVDQHARELLGVALLEGTDLFAVGTNVALVTAKTAASFWPGQSAIGRRIDVSVNSYSGSDRDGRGRVPLEVVGVVEDVAEPFGRPALPTVYVRLAEEMAPAVFLVADVAPTSVSTFATELGSFASSVNPRFAVTSVARVEDAAREPRDVYVARAASVVFSLLAGLAVIMTVCGLYGLVHFLTLQRQRETAIRLALGGTTSHILFVNCGRIAMSSAAGVVLATGLFLGLAALMRSWFPNFPAITSSEGLLVPVLILACTTLVAAVPVVRYVRGRPWTMLQSS